MDKNVLVNKCRGSLIGGAAGDALGYAVEFSSLRSIIDVFGRPGICDYRLDYMKTARFSDDTQMTLFTAEAILSAAQKGNEFDPDAIRKEMEKAYLAWYATQTEFQLPLKDSWLSNLRGLWSLRAPGNTCLTALKQIKDGKEVTNHSKGCGGVMRVAPIGIFYGADSLSEPNNESCEGRFAAVVASDAAYITHHNVMSCYASALSALIVYRCILESEPISKVKFRSIVDECLLTVFDLNPKSNQSQTFEKIIREAMRLGESDMEDFDAIRQLGEGWVAEETIAIAIFCVLRYIDDFEKCIVCAVNHDGDSDSTGAVAGNIIGAIVGYQAIPDKYKEHLEMLDVLLSVADDLAGVSGEEQMDERYLLHKAYGVDENLTIFGTMKFTPEKIVKLEPDEIFVFGSNLAGHHAGGAARIARLKFGAIEGQGVGLQGQSYAIPTMQGGVDTIKPYVDEFLDLAEEWDQNTFLVTRIGCGIAGFRDEEIAPLFKRALRMYNVRLPESFVRILLEKQ